MKYSHLPQVKPGMWTWRSIKEDQDQYRCDLNISRFKSAYEQDRDEDRPSRHWLGIYSDSSGSDTDEEDEEKKKQEEDDENTQLKDITHQSNSNQINTADSKNNKNNKNNNVNNNSTNNNNIIKKRNYDTFTCSNKKQQHHSSHKINADIKMQKMIQMINKIVVMANKKLNLLHQQKRTENHTSPTVTELD